MKKRTRFTLQDCIDYVSKRNGKCLSDKLMNTTTKMLWECHLGHRWEATFSSFIYMNSWCPTCSGQNPKENYLKLQAILKEKGWTLVSGTYENAQKSNLLIQCDKGHQWNTSYTKIRYYNCPECSGCCRDREKNIAAITTIIQTKKGTWVSGDYQNARSRITIECEKGHQWTTKAMSIRNANTWCPSCCGFNKAEQLEVIKKISNSRGGKCCSTYYQNKDSKLKFICNNGHEFMMKPHSVKQGQWCPNCSLYIMESKTRYTLEKLTGASFERNGTRIPGFVLDGHHKFQNLKMEVAFEYHGRQHYEFIEYFHETKGNFIKRQEDDKIKRKECALLNIHLLEVPHFLVETDEQLLLFVKQFLRNVGLNSPFVESVEDFFKDFYLKSPQLKRIEKIIKEKGGKLLTYEYNGAKKSSITIECKLGHKWTTKYATLTVGRWCPNCAGRSRDGKWLYQELKKLAEMNGLILLTPHYAPDREKVKLRCNQGHFFERRVNTLKRGTFSCPYCTGKLPREEKEKELRSFIEKKDGVLLSKYISNKVNVDIQCEKGHVFSIRPNNLTSGKKQWCKYCNQQFKH